MRTREFDADGGLTRSLRHRRTIAAVQERYVSLRNYPLREVVVTDCVVHSSSEHLKVYFSWVVWLGFGISWFILMPVRAWTAARRRHPLIRHWRRSQLLFLHGLQLLLLLNLLLLLELLLLNLILLHVVRLHDRLLLLRLVLMHRCSWLHRCNLLGLLSLHVLRLCTVRTHIDNDASFESLLSHLTRGLRLLTARRLHLLVLLRRRVLLLEFLRQLLILSHNHSCLRRYLEMLPVHVTCG